MNIKKVIRSYSLVIFALFSGGILAAESGSEKLNAFVEKVVTFQAKFKQTVVDDRGRVIDEASGLFILERPGKFRWDYQEPFPQYIVADGERIWFYDVDLEQVTVQSQSEALADTPATLLSGNTKPEDKYSLTDMPSEDGLSWVMLFPKEADSNYQTVTLAFDELGLNQMIMKDSFDQKTRIVFSQTVENKQLEKDVFVFTPPTGVDVVGDTGLDK